MLTATPWYFLPQFRPARLQDCVLWLESDSFSGGIWRNLAPNYSDRNHGTAHGGVGLFTWHPQFPPAPTFDGVNDYVEVPDDDSLDITDAITIELWTKIDDASSDIATNQYWISKGTGAYNDAVNNTYLFYIVNAGSDPTGYNDFIRFTLSDGSSFYNTYLSSKLRMNAFGPNKRYHLVATWDGAKMKIYKNGVHISDADKSFSGSINSLSANLNIGRHTDGTRYFDGTTPLVRIYKAALTPAEVVHNYTHHPLYYLQRGIDPYEVLTAATAAAAPSI